MGLNPQFLARIDNMLKEQEDDLSIVTVDTFNDILPHVQKASGPRQFQVRDERKIYIHDGAAFTGTAAQLRDKLAGEVFGEGVADNTNIKTLKELTLKARWDNPRLSGTATDQPTVTASASQPSGLTTAFRHYTHPGLFRILGGREYIFSTSFVRVPSYTLPAGQTGNVGGNEGANGARIEFLVDAAKFAIKIAGSSINYRIIVDGKYLSAAGVATSGMQYILVDYSAGSGRKVRSVILELEQNQAFDGVYVSPTETVFRSPSHPFRMIVVGDSIQAGTGAGLLNDAMSRVMGDYLGISDLWQSAQGGTGYLNNGTTKYVYQDRLALDVTNRSPNVVITAGGTNDTSSAALQSAVDTYIRQFRSALPDVPHFVLGVVSGTNASAKEGYIKAAIEAFADPLTFFIPITTDATGAWLTGTGKAGATTGNGNNDIYMSADAIHPTQAGHAYLGMRAADAVINKLSSL